MRGGCRKAGQVLYASEAPRDTSKRLGKMRTTGLLKLGTVWGFGWPQHMTDYGIQPMQEQESDFGYLISTTMPVLHHTKKEFNLSPNSVSSTFNYTDLKVENFSGTDHLIHGPQ
jgi:hypothetical protein